ncbi:hypothetical protein [Chryseobacterium potabilaquae]|uniref:Uncharacterized protein n=1 Tax=Chryseobacterium potabilaquae TaxID=2675057 RepID=A0A6N4X7Y1_9FLAO|nr:hypothetical protein [Chryseobacterium potabilaquae]CAA7195561.1 hypothetical protein CHRY9293_01748 [Chryseobacterium potabilaquae]
MIKTIFTFLCTLLSAFLYNQSLSLILPEPDRKKLDSIVMSMVRKNETDDNIRVVIANFKLKYGHHQSDDWDYISSSVSANKYYIKRLIHNSNISDFWVKIISKSNEYSIEHWKIYCNSNELVIFSATDYSAQGFVKVSEEYTETPKPIIPDSIADSIRENVCEKPIK